MQEILSELSEIAGKTGFYYKNLVTGSVIKQGEEIPMMAASVIKIPIMVAVFTEIKAGKLKKDDMYYLRNEDKKPSCGCLNRLHEGIGVTIEDLCNLMIILSDNSATNILINIVGRDRINEIISELGYKVIKLNRYLFDSEAAEQGIQNYVNCIEIADMLEKMYNGILINKESSKEMLDILKEQRLNSKIPFFFKEMIEVAHKTGEDEGITHDVGIVYGKQPFIVCFMGNEVDTPVFEQFMQKTSLRLYQSTSSNIPK